MEDANELRRKLYMNAVQAEGGCLYKGNSADYGTIQHKSRTYRNHRLAYESEHGQIPEGKIVMHKCDTPGCFNPSHLQLGTQAENMADMRAKNRNNDKRGLSKQNRPGGTVPFLVRLRPEIRDLLEKASTDQRRSMASLIDQCVRDQLQTKYGELNPRLQKFLMGAKQ